ncbi:MAG: S8 family serine peptidase, partial [Bacteroidota bacterium]
NPATGNSMTVVGAPSARSQGCTGAGQEVVIIDTGVENSHPAFSGRIVAEACYSTGGGSSGVSLCPGGGSNSTAAGSGDDCGPYFDSAGWDVFGCGHGTMVAGVAVGNGGGVTGAATSAGIISMQVFTRYNEVSDCPAAFATPCVKAFNSDILAAVDRAVVLAATRPISAVNLSVDMSSSLGLKFSACDADLPAMKTAVDQLNAYGVAVTSNAGNQGAFGGLVPPACLSNVFAIMGTQDGSTHNSQSTTVDAVMPESNKATFADFWAPGEWITSANPGTSSTHTVRGTSMSAPHVAGAFAMLKSKQPALTLAQMEDLLRSNGPDVTFAGTVTKRRLAIGDACADISAEVAALNLMVFLEGPYAGSSQMTTALNSGGWLPTSQPYADARFNGTPLDYDEAVTLPSAFFGTRPDVVDYVLVELWASRMPASKQATVLGLLRKDGIVTAMDGVSALGIPKAGLTQSAYYVVVRHRNHVPVMSQGTVNVAVSSTAYDFTTAASQTYGANASVQLASGVWGLPAGNASHAEAGQVSGLDALAALGQPAVTGYLDDDFDLDGTANVTDLLLLWLKNNGSSAGF